MEIDKTYRWKKFEDGKYEPSINTSFNLHATTTIEIFKENCNIEAINFHRLYDNLEIPFETESFLNSLLLRFEVEEYKSDFITLGCAFQLQYINNYLTTFDKPLEDFDSEKKDYLPLFNCLESYLFSEDKKNLNSISFKYNRSDTITIRNVFIVNEIYSAICLGFGLTKENFEERKSEILSLTNLYKVSMYSELVKNQYIKILFDFLSPKIKNESQALKFIGVFMHIFQISTTNKRSNIELYSDIDDNLSSIDIKNFKHYISRLKKYHH